MAKVVNAATFGTALARSTAARTKYVAHSALQEVRIIIKSLARSAMIILIAMRSICVVRSRTLFGSFVIHLIRGSVKLLMCTKKPSTAKKSKKNL